MKVRSLSANTDILFKFNKCGDDGLLRSQLVVVVCVLRNLRLVAVAVYFALRPKVSLKLNS